MNIILEHGWGFDGDCFNALASKLNGHNVKINNARYFAEGLLIRHDINDAILVGHSMGLIRILAYEKLMPRLKAIIGINSFTRFNNDLLPRMIKAFKVNPENTLNAFYGNCHFKPEVMHDVSQINKDILLSDLELLKVGDISDLLLNSQIPSINIVSTNDVIASNASFDGFADVVHIESNSHCLHIEETSKCAEIIMEFLKKHEIYS